MRGSLGKWLILGLGQGTCQMSLEHHRGPESKEVLQNPKGRGCVTGTQKATSKSPQCSKPEQRQHKINHRALGYHPEYKINTHESNLADTVFLQIETLCWASVLTPFSQQHYFLIEVCMLILQTQGCCTLDRLQNVAAAKTPQSCPTLCDPTDGSPPGSPVPGILQARTLEWVAISFSNAGKWKVKVKSLSRAWLLVTPWTAAHQVPPSMGVSRQEYWSGVPLPSPTE